MLRTAAKAVAPLGSTTIFIRSHMRRMASMISCWWIRKHSIGPRPYRTHLICDSDDLLDLLLYDGEVQHADRSPQAISDRMSIHVWYPRSLLKTSRAIIRARRLCSKDADSCPIRSERRPRQESTAPNGRNNSGEFLRNLLHEFDQCSSLSQYRIHRVVGGDEGRPGPSLHCCERYRSRGSVGLAERDVGPVRAHCIDLRLGRVVGLGKRGMGVSQCASMVWIEASGIWARTMTT